MRDDKRYYQIPDADAVVDPKQEDCPYPFQNLCGAGVAYKLVQALYGFMGMEENEAEQFLEYAAIATIGDVMELQDENRILVKEGMKLLRKTENLGLRALIELNGLEPASISAFHIGFVIGPCLNAGGRLDTAKRSLDLLMAENKKEADLAAGELKALNDSRKEMTKKGTEEAVRLIEEGKIEDRVLVIYLKHCHESLAGIIAGRLRERYYKPCFVLTKGEESIKGSGRSIEAYPMYDELVKCSEYLEKFGGHPMAAGLSLKEENIDRLRSALNMRNTLTEEDMVEKIWIDVPMPISYITFGLVEQLEYLEPFGRGNEKPVFADKNLKILQKRIVGRNKNAVKLLLEDPYKNQMDGIYFGDGEAFFEATKQADTIAVLYYPSINEYRGSRTIQVVITKYMVLNAE
jgi:single-stranded-DNA-specific exonuclease